MSRRKTASPEAFLLQDYNVLSGYRGRCAEVIIPEGVAKVEAGVFRGRKSIRRVVLPNSLETIGAGAFRGCIHLEEVVGSCSLREVGEDAFSGTPWLLGQGDYPVIHGVLVGRPPLTQGDLVLPESVQAIPKGMFCGCTGLTGISLPNGLERIDTETFADCSHLERVRLPEGLKEIADNAFRNCIRLEQITFPRSLKKILHDAFQGCIALQEISLPKNLTILGYGAFQNCRALAQVKLSPAMNAVGSYAFRNCTSLEEMVIPRGVDKIYNDAFCGCTRLRHVKLPGTLQEIEERAFSKCTALEEIELPFDVYTIKEEAFCECTSLRSMSVPYSTVLGNGAFALSGLEKVRLDHIHDIPTCCFRSCKSLKEVEITGEMKRIEEGAFYECSQLQQINLPDQVEYIGFMAFAFCPLVQLDLPGNLKEVGNCAFLGCGSLRALTIPSTLQSIGHYAFSSCTGLQRVVLQKDAKFDAEPFLGCLSQTVVVPQDHTALQPVRDGLLLSRDGKTLVWCERFTAGVVCIPEGVEEIGESAFEECTDITGVVLPKSLKRIAKRGLARCGQIIRAEVPAGVEHIGEQAFFGCTALQSAALPKGLKTIGKQAFQNTALPELTIPDGVEEVGEKILQGCPVRLVTVQGSTAAFQGALLDPEPSDMELHTAEFTPDQLPASPVSWVRGYFGQLQRGETACSLPDRDFRTYIRRNCKLLWVDPVCLHGMLQYRLLPAGKVDAALEAVVGSGDTSLVTDLLEYQRTLRREKEAERDERERDQRREMGTIQRSS